MPNVVMVSVMAPVTLLNVQVSILKVYTAVNNIVAKKANLFVAVLHLHSSLLFASKPRAYPNSLRRLSTNLA
jgi:hypothetical protein